MHNLTIQKLDRPDVNHLIGLIRVYETVFEMAHVEMPHADYLSSLLKNDGMIFMVALLDDTVIGGLTAYVLPSPYYPSSEVYLYDLAVMTALQRQGVGKRLLAALQHHCAALGYREIFVQADLVDQHAIDFYRSTGGVPEDVIHFSYGLNNPPA